MKEDLDTDSRYTDIKLVTVAYGDDNTDKSYRLTGSLLKTYPNLKAIIAPTSVGINAAAQYLSQSPFKGKVKLTGLGTPNGMREYVKDGTVESFRLWDPTELGKLAAWTAESLPRDRSQDERGKASAPWTDISTRSESMALSTWAIRPPSPSKTSTNTISNTVIRRDDCCFSWSVSFFSVAAP